MPHGSPSQSGRALLAHLEKDGNGPFPLPENQPLQGFGPPLDRSRTITRLDEQRLGIFLGQARAGHEEEEGISDRVVS